MHCGYHCAVVQSNYQSKRGNNMRILIDMDDTIEQLLVAWLKRVNEKYGRNVCYEDITQWDVSAAYPGLTHDQVYNEILEDDFWQEVRPIPDAPEVMERLMQQGHELYIVTATPYESVVGKMEHVLFRYFPFISWNQVIITANKQLLKADVMIDDGIHNLAGGDYIKLLVDAPYNRAYNAEANGMIRVHSWKEIETILAELSRQ